MGTFYSLFSSPEPVPVVLNLGTGSIGQKWRLDGSVHRVQQRQQPRRPVQASAGTYRAELGTCSIIVNVITAKA